MSSVTEAIKLLEEQLQDLQRDTTFCFNNYDYHHKNNEHEIIKNLQYILKDFLQAGEQFLDYIKNIRSSIDMAHEKCLEIDELLLNLGLKTEVVEASESCPTGSQSFHEEQEKDKKYSVDVMGESK